MSRLHFNFFITQRDGTIFGSAEDDDTHDKLAYCFAPNGCVRERTEAGWQELKYDDAVFVRVLAGRAYGYVKNYLTQSKVF